jgi:predicted DNA-binding transcriptional regulator AlpA
MTLADDDVEPDGPTLDEIRGWPAVVEVRRGARALGISVSWAYELIAAGEFPCRVLTVRGRSRVITASLIATLDEPGEP